MMGGLIRRTTSIGRNIESSGELPVLAPNQKVLGIWERCPVAYAPTGNDIESALNSLAKQRIAAIVVLPSGMFEKHAARMAQIAVERRIALIASTRVYAERGSLLGYGQNYGAFTRRAATYVDKIFKGAKPSELPVEQPMILELTINLTTAKKLGLTIPTELLLRADNVIDDCFWPIADPPGGAESEGVPPNNGLQTDAPKARAPEAGR
jgi:hypothetical protein